MSGCKSETPHRDAKFKERANKTTRERREDRTQGYLFGERLFSSNRSKKNETAGIGVNSYLWKASLKAVSFVPKRSVDPFGGTILTEWYSDPENPTERLRIEILILGRTLRSDALKVSIFREAQKSKGTWVAVPSDPKTSQQFEEAILVHARDMKIADSK